MLSGENGILSKASSAGEETKISTAKEIAGVDLSAIIADYYKNKYANNTDSAYTGTLSDYITTNWTTTSDATQYTVAAGVPTLTPKTSDGKSIVGSVNSNGALTWTEVTPSSGSGD